VITKPLWRRLTAFSEHMCAEQAGDGEGATHLMTCEVTHAPDVKTARAVRRSVVCSNLFKATVFGRDAHRARILCAMGYTPGDFSTDKVSVWLSSKAGEVYVCENAAYHPYSEDEAAKVLAEHDVLVKVDMGTGDASAKARGCDLTYEYVKMDRRLPHLITLSGDARQLPRRGSTKRTTSSRFYK